MTKNIIRIKLKIDKRLKVLAEAKMPDIRNKAKIDIEITQPKSAGINIKHNRSKVEIALRNEYFVL